MLTLSQRRTFEFILQFIHKNDYSPTAAEIAQGIGIKSRGVVHRYLKGLQENGYIRLMPKRHRNIELLQKEFPTQLSQLPLIGNIAAGQPIEAIEQYETVDVLNVFLGENRFALRVKGDSMIEEGIHDNDIIVCEKTESANNGQIVVALIDQQEATLKRIQFNPDEMVTLLPANSSLAPITYPMKRIQIQGIYIGLLRLYSS